MMTVFNETELAFGSPDAVAAVQARLGHTFTHRWLLHAALTHSSVLAEAKPHDTQGFLAWLGVTELQAIATEDMVLKYVRAGAGATVHRQLAAARATLLSRAACARHARALGIDAPGAIATGRSFKMSGAGVSEDMLSTAFQAVVGAVALDAGREAARTASSKVNPYPGSEVRDLMAAYG
jgi:ribonuclease III